MAEAESPVVDAYNGSPEQSLWMLVVSFLGCDLGKGRRVVALE